jgi:hypothetical protein
MPHISKKALTLYLALGGLGVLAVGASYIASRTIQADTIAEEDQVPVIECGKESSMTQFTWLVTFPPEENKLGTVERLGRSQNKTLVCETSLITGQENAQLQLVDSAGKVVFERSVLLPLSATSHENSSGHHHVLSVPQNDYIMQTYLPYEQEKDLQGLSLRFLRLSDTAITLESGKVLSSKTIAEGRP